MIARPSQFAGDGPLNEAEVSELVQKLPTDHDVLGDLKPRDVRRVVEGLARSLADTVTASGARWIENPTFDPQVIARAVASFHGTTKNLPDSLTIPVLENVAASLVGAIARKAG